MSSAKRFPRVRRCGSTWLVVLVVSMLALGVMTAAVVWYSQASTSDLAHQPITSPVLYGDFAHVITEQGEVESSSNVDIRCQVKGKGNGASTTILWIIPEGTHVEPGQKLVEFESSHLKEEETQQRIVTEQARAAKIQAELAYETAKIAVDEYLNGTFKQELQAIESEITIAQENLRRAQDYARYSEGMAAKGYITATQLEADQFAVTNSRLSLETAETKKRVLENYTKKKMLNQLQGDLGAAEAQMKAHQASFELEEEKLNDLRVQLEKCVVYAPSAGQVVYANELDRRGNVENLIDEGVPVRERQVVIRLPDPGKMQVKTKIKESRIGLIKPGQFATVRVDAMPGVELQGKVIKVDAIPLPVWYSNVKEYATYVEISDPPPGLKPGMTSKVSVLVNEINDCIQVPVQAVKQIAGEHYVCEFNNESSRIRHVHVGAKNDKYVVIRSGLEKGIDVVLNPEPILRKKFPKQDMSSVANQVARERAEKSRERKKLADKQGKTDRQEDLQKDVAKQEKDTEQASAGAPGE